MKSENSSELYIFLTIFKVIPVVSLLHLMAIFQILLLIIWLNNTNLRLLQPFIDILNPQGFDGLKTLCVMVVHFFLTHALDLTKLRGKISKEVT